MNKGNLCPILAVLTTLMLGACGGSQSDSSVSAPTPSTPPPTAAVSPLEAAFPVSVDVFGVMVRATSDTRGEKVLHAANVMAQYLDNNEDGLADNLAVVEQMVTAGATLLMAPNEQRFEAATSNIQATDAYQDLRGNETFPTPESGRFDATLEEVLHLITHVGYAHVYPEIFGENKDSSVADAMDIARGGRFDSVPTQYPPGAWFTYDDQTCDYACMVTEYTYWALTSILGAQTERLEEIQQEWQLNTEEKVRLGDPAVYTIMTNAEYALATELPDGQYSAKTLSLHGVTDNPGQQPVPSEAIIGANSESACRLSGINDQPACFIITGNQAEMNGVIGSQIVNKVNRLINEHPQVTRILLVDVPGSMDDESNLEAARLIFNANLNTEVKATSQIASGGVDFFLAGKKRIIEPGAEIGVHSWAYEDEQGNTVQGRDVPRNDAQHDPYIQFYQYVEHPNPSEFYFYTLDAAPAEDIHIMTEDEISFWQMARE